MSYNGIGLASVRGSATSGHVQGNRSYIRPSNFRRQVARNSGAAEEERNTSSSKLTDLVSRGVLKGKNDDIVRHSKLRDIEARLLDYEERLEEDGVSDEDRQAMVGEERRRLMDLMGLKQAKPKVAEESKTPAAPVDDDDEVDFEGGSE
eukprot:CAMPEP_0182472498 /NCGR_PEP_ID=MMETSP1319-20130603/22247_1 /TAXON_ID=172717 /ORGANISM="Bolidomonas pacifica, Strain RCC208" /LENGTH=148 /DNA_ID=CAMNT_0024673189 /DNA_START=121 /DNA_END=564 /DNA_ORIENTATION=-